ncbi:Uncharacterized protein YhfX [Brachyspira suanatina]|uniref:Uncharacterized protein YhfX n=1 Tax=Brachyspira suanatina TaxID=381802 RepID=A0A0G4K714_9SPIR|nr:YhfX family PLP-dependent enzyme [Brachyspira suanatina]CRF33377.1 Uncharacterized protein YhfX [Brachyspira suanatina]
MFLDVVRNNNFDLIKIALDFHKRGLILPDSYVLDVDTILENAARILEEANKNNIKLYAMTKQIGRVPYIAKKIVDIGYLGIVAVDFKETQVMIDNNIKLGNIGHLVQIPNKMIEEVVKYGSDIITVYSLDKILEINKAAEKIGKVQDIMIKVIDNNDTIYPGQYGGFYLDEIKNHIDKILSLKNIRINGITSFPCFLYNSDLNKIEATRNVETIHKCNNILNEFGVKVEQLNMPSTTSLENIKYIKEYGGTHGEPGHALTGTTPFNSKNFGQEKPAIIYLSEISHNLNSKSYFYGGGHYRRSHISKLLVGNDINNLMDFEVNIPSLDNIDYYFDFDNDNKNVNVGDTVISSFRTQIFVTRSDVVLIEGIKSGNPKIVGIYDSLGRIK